LGLLPSMEVGKKASSRRGGGKPYDAAMQLHNLQNPVSSVSSDGAHRRRWQETKTSSALVGQEGGVDSGAHSQGSGEDLYEYREGQESVENNKPEFSDNTYAPDSLHHNPQHSNSEWHH